MVDLCAWNQPGRESSKANIPSSTWAFKYPEIQDIRTIPTDDILTLADPRTRIGRVYTLSKKETTSASERFCVVSADQDS